MSAQPMPKAIEDAALAILLPYLPTITAESLKELAKNPTEEKKPLLKIKEAAALLSLSRQHISKLAEVGELDRINVGIEKTLYRITAESIDRFLARRAS